MNAEWRPVSGLPCVIESINELLPYERELSEILGENEILKLGKTICRAGNFIEIVSMSKNGAYNYKYFQIENGQLKMAYDFGTCASGFDQKVVSPVKYVLVDGVWRDEKIWKEVEKNKKYTVTFCSYTYHYDNDESLELECDFQETATLEDLTEDARAICEMAARNDDYFKTMTMKEAPFVSVNEEDGYIDVTFDFVEGDFMTDIRVYYTVEVTK